MKLLLTGATGAAGLQVLRTALADPQIAQVTVLARRPLPAWTSIPESSLAKAKIVTHSDFLSYTPDIIGGHDACVWALGKSSNGMSEKDYMVLTHDYTLAAAEAIMSANERNGTVDGEAQAFRFVFFSGEGASQSGKSLVLFSRVKGRTEADLLEKQRSSNGSFEAHILRPGYFAPATDTDLQNMRTGSGQIMNKIMTPLFNTLWPGGMIPTPALARFAVEAAKGTWGRAPDSEQNVFGNKRMRELLKERGWLDIPGDGLQELRTEF